MMMITTVPSPQTTSSNKADIVMKSSCGDLQSRLKVRKMLGVGDTTGSVGSAGSKISQILGHSDNLIFQLPPTLAAWLLLTAGLFGCFTVMGLVWPACLRLLLPGALESTLHLSTSYAFLVTILALTLRSGDKTSLQLVLVALVFFHSLSCFTALWFVKTSDTKTKSIISLILHLACLFINLHFYRSMLRGVSSSRSTHKLKTYFNSILSFPSSADVNGYDSS